MITGKCQQMLLRSLLAESNPELAALHSTNIELMDSRLKRLVAHGLRGAAVACPAMTSRLAGLDWPIDGYTVIGLGSDSAVFKKGDTVTKAHLLSLPLKHKQQEEDASAKRQSYRALHSKMNEFMLDQTVSVGKVPGTLSKSIVKTDQPYRQLEYTNLFQGNQAAPNETSLSDIATRRPTALKQLSRFVTRGLELYQEEGMAPDILGNNNLGFDRDGALVLIDGYPLSVQERRPQTELAATQLTQVGELLNL